MINKVNGIPKEIKVFVGMYKYVQSTQYRRITILSVGESYIIEYRICRIANIGFSIIYWFYPADNVDQRDNVDQ